MRSKYDDFIGQTVMIVLIAIFVGSAAMTAFSTCHIYRELVTLNETFITPITHQTVTVTP